MDTNLPIHALYTDNTMIFCQGNKKALLAILKISRDYGEASSQLINSNKSNFYTGAMLLLWEGNIQI